MTSSDRPGFVRLADFVHLENGWTGGQYSLYRGLLGLYLAYHFARLVPYAGELFSGMGMVGEPSASPFYGIFPNLLFVFEAPAVAAGLLVMATFAGLAFALGARDRLMAGFLWYVLACTFTRNPLIANPSLPFLGWLLLLHLAIPGKPYGAWSARGRSDPGGGFRFPPALFAAAWIVMAVGYSYSGYTKLVSPSWLDGSALSRILENPLARPSLLREVVLQLPTVLLASATWGALLLELLFAPLALIRRLRPWLSLAMVVMHLGLIALIDFAALSFAMLILHLATFDPSWLPGRAGKYRLFYDGDCGLCHRAVRFLLAEDRDGSFRFAPLSSPAFAALPRDLREDLPDSLVLVSLEAEVPGSLWIRSDAVIVLLMSLGGLWRILGWLLQRIPRSWRDALYDGVARLRSRLFVRPEAACPIVPEALRKRFDL